MSLQYYDFVLPINKSKEVGAQGRFIYYRSGTTPNIANGTVLATTENHAIKVRPGGTSNAVILIPGQSYRMKGGEKAPQSWVIENFNNAEQITGIILIGDDEFGDNNVANTFKLDGTFTNTVSVNNTVAAPAHVDLSLAGASVSAANRLPVTLDVTQTLNIGSNTVAYTLSQMTSGGLAALAPLQVHTAAQNPNGAVLESCRVLQSTASPFVMIAKTGNVAPSSLIDGDIIHSGSPAANITYAMDITKDGRIRYAAGKSLWYVPKNVEAADFRSFLVTAL